MNAFCIVMNAFCTVRLVAKVNCVNLSYEIESLYKIKAKATK